MEPISGKQKQRQEFMSDAMKPLAQKVTKTSHGSGPRPAREPGLGAPSKENNRESGIVYRKHRRDRDRTRHYEKATGA